MKENVLDVLMYLFENYFDEDTDVEADKDVLVTELAEAGFSEPEISKAFAWLDSLAYDRSPDTANHEDRVASLRVYTWEESGRLDLECKGYLLYLEQAGVLDTSTREMIIDRAMALETPNLDLDQLKWVVMMVMFNQPGNEQLFTWMEDFVVDRESCRLH